MDDLINKIIEIDSKAEKKIYEAKVQKDHALEEVNREIEELKKALIAHSNEKINSYRSFEEQKANESIQENAAANEVRRQKIQMIFNQNHSQWEEEIYKRVLAGE